MSAKHTPGPWVPCEPGDYSDYNGKCRVILGDDTRIAVVIGLRDENRANARLIAAAPELLEALQQAFDFPPDFFDRSDDELEQITVSGRHLRMVRAAIAKATGEPA